MAEEEAKEKKSRKAEHKESGKDSRRDRSRSNERKKSKRDKRDKDADYDRHKRSRRDSRERSRSSERRPRRDRDRDRDERRYWNDDQSSLYRRNSDRYWNKYARDDEQVVGSRYFDGIPVSRKRNRSYTPEERSSRRERDERNGKEQKKNSSNDKENEKTNSEPQKPETGKKPLNPITSRTGGAYIPPAKLKMMQAAITDKSSSDYQRIAWEALKKSIHGLINKVNTSNIGEIIKELLKENIVRGRGLLCKSIIQAQALSPTFTHVYAALVALINSRFPNIGELLLRRLILQFKRGFKRNDKNICMSSTAFIAHLVNQRVAHEIIALEILTLLVETPTDHSIEIAISFLKECGMRLSEVSSKGVEAIFQMLRNILHEGKLDRRVDYMIEVILQIRKDNFKDHEAIVESLDLVEEEDQFTHIITLEDPMEPEDILNVFKFDPQYIENEDKFKALSKEMLGESGESGDESDESGSEDSDEESNEEEDEEEKQLIIDRTETNLVSLRRTIYLTIYSSLDYEECAHKLMKMEFKPGQEVELCNMILDCCCEMRTYEKFFGLLAQRFCQINKMYIPPFENMFKDSYETVYRLKPNQLRNVAKFFAHLLFTDAISWEVLNCIRLNEEDTTSSGRIFIKIVFQELSEYMGLMKLNERVKDVTLQEAFCGLFPRDNPKNTRFAINFFTSIGLGGLTDDLREHLKGQVKTEVFDVLPAAPSSSSSESDSSSDSSEDSSESSDSSSSSSESDSNRKSKKSKGKTKKLEKAKKSKKSKTKKKKALKKKSSKSRRRER
ncbi:hypothetical protein RUM43_008691 [Polyplax serrata]|uniref:MI domain-containing protein n=1 Tax=Polyplax serrata TaxID=468196 RepID=A0AAN8S1I1_POLSC